MQSILMGDCLAADAESTSMFVFEVKLADMNSMLGLMALLLHVYCWGVLILYTSLDENFFVKFLSVLICNTYESTLLF
jgi:hypothetical protein